MNATENHEPAQPLAVPLSDQLGPMPKLLGDGGACFWCGQKLLGQCKGQYESLSCVNRPLDGEDGPTPAEWAALDANARGQK